MKQLLFLLLAAVGLLSACSEDDNTVSEYANWPARNITAFRDTLAQANAAIAAARATHGEAWTDACSPRLRPPKVTSSISRAWQAMWTKLFAPNTVKRHALP